MYADWVERISYKPRWSLSVDTPAAGQIRITVQYVGDNSRGPGERPIAHCRIVPYPARFEDFVAECIVTFQELENHEVREWFRVDDKHWPDFLPHDPKAVMVPFRNTGARYDAYREKTVNRIG